jgi:hypothetical protein
MSVDLKPAAMALTILPPSDANLQRCVDVLQEATKGRLAAWIEKGDKWALSEDLGFFIMSGPSHVVATDCLPPLREALTKVGLSCDKIIVSIDGGNPILNPSDDILRGWKSTRVVLPAHLANNQMFITALTPEPIIVRKLTKLEDDMNRITQGNNFSGWREQTIGEGHTVLSITGPAHFMHRYKDFFEKVAYYNMGLSRPATYIRVSSDWPDATLSIAKSVVTHNRFRDGINSNYQQLFMICANPEVYYTPEPKYPVERVRQTSFVDLNAA